MFNEQATVVHPLTKWSSTDRVSLEKSIMRFRPGGGTNLTEGLRAANKMYSGAGEGNNSSNRVFVLTDMEVEEQNDGVEFTSKIIYDRMRSYRIDDR